MKPQNMRLTITANHGRYSWIIPVPIFEVEKNGFQTLTIPVSGKFKIEIAAPAHWVENSRAYAPGISTFGTFLLKKGQRITVVLGQMRNNPNCISCARRDKHEVGRSRPPDSFPGRRVRRKSGRNFVSLSQIGCSCRRPIDILSRSKFCFPDPMVGPGVPELFSRHEFRDARPPLGASFCVMDGEHGPEPLLAVGNEGNFSTDSYSKFGLHFGFYGHCKIQRQED